MYMARCQGVGTGKGDDDGRAPGRELLILVSNMIVTFDQQPIVAVVRLFQIQAISVGLLRW